MSMEQINEIKNILTTYMVDYGLDVIGAVAILIVGWVVANWLSGRVGKFTGRAQRIDSTVSPLLVKGTKALVLIITILAVLNQFGVETASIIAVLGAIGLAIGLALQGTLTNIASGFMLLVLRPFNVGDTVDIGGTVGVVDEIGLFVTEINTFDNIFITMPNSIIWGGKIENYTRNTTRRVDMEFGIHYDDDIDKAIKIIQEILDADERILAEPEPLIAVGSLADSAVIIRVRPWTATENVWPLRYDLTKQIKQRFDAENITFPFPQRDIYVHQDNSE